MVEYWNTPNDIILARGRPKKERLRIAETAKQFLCVLIRRIIIFNSLEFNRSYYS